MKDRLVSGAVLAVLIALAVYWFNCGPGKHEASRSGTTPSAASNASTGSSRTDTPTAGATPDAGTLVPARVAHTKEERAAMLQAIEAARSRRTAAGSTQASASGGATGGSASSTATTLNIEDKTGDTSEWEKRALGTLNSVLGECYDLGRADDPKLEGKVMLRFSVVGEPKVGGLLESVEIVDESTTISQQTIRDCMTNSLYALELDPPPEGMRVEREVSLKFP